MIQINSNVGRSDPQNTYDVAVQMARLAASRSALETICIYSFDDVETSVSQCDVAVVCHSSQIRYVCDVTTVVRCVGYINDNVGRSDRIRL